MSCDSLLCGKGRFYMKKYENFCSALCNMKEIYKYSKENVKEILIHADHSYNNKKILLSKKLLRPLPDLGFLQFFSQDFPHE